MHSLDTFVQNYFSIVRTPHLTELMYIVSRFFDVSFYFVTIVLCFSLLIYLVRNLKYTILFISTLVSSSILVYFLKLFFNVNRPPYPVVYAFGQSFPSYHSTMATIFFIMLIYIFDDYLKTFSRILFNSFCIGVIILVSFSRLYLGEHWFSDVFFGIILGSVISYISILIFRRVIDRQSNTSMLK